MIEVCMYVWALDGGGGSSCSSSSSSAVRTFGNLITGLHVTSEVFQCIFQGMHAGLVFVFAFLFVMLYKTR